MRYLACCYLWGAAASYLGLAIGNDDPFYLILATGCATFALWLTIGSITPDRSNQHGNR